MGMEAAILGSAAIGAVAGKKGQKQTSESNPYSAFPEIPGMVREDIFPRAKEEYNKPFPSLPKKRAADPSKDPFASLGMWEYQQAKDADLLNSAMNPSAIPPSSAQPTQATALDTLRQELLGLQTAQNRASTHPAQGIFGKMTPGSPYWVQQQMQNNGMQQWYTLTPQQQQEVIRNYMNGQR